MAESAIERKRRTRVEAWVGPWLRSIRASRKPRQDIAHVAAVLDVTISTLSRIERGDTRFPADELPKFLAAYGTTYDAFADHDRAVQRVAKRQQKRAA